MQYLKFLYATMILFVITSAIVAQQYSFIAEVDMYKGDEKQGPTQKLQYIINGQSTAIQILRDGEPMITNIMDIEAGTMTMVTNVGGARAAMRMNLPDRTGHSTGRAKEPGDDELKRTGETKEIDGHICHLYQKDDEKQFVEVWIAEDLHLDLIDRMQMLEQRTPTGGQKGTPPKINYPQVKGFPMLTYVEQKGDKSEGSMTRMSNIKVSEIDLSVFNLEGLKIVDMNQKEEEGEKN